MFSLSGKLLGALTGIAAAAVIAAMLPAGQVSAAGTGSEVEDNDSIFKANTIVEDTEYSASFSSKDDVDYFKFTLPKSGRVAFTGTFDNSHYYAVYDSSEKVLYSNSISSDSGERRLTCDLTAGTYYLRLKSVYYTGNYSFHFAYTPANETYEESGNGTNNTFSTSNPIALGTTYTGQLARNDMMDYYKFTISAVGTMILNTSSDYSASYYIYDVNEKQLYNSSTYDKEHKFSYVLTPGTYYLEVKTTNRTGVYSFSYQFNNAAITGASASVVCGNQLDLDIINASGLKVAWSTNNTRIATVNDYGYVRGLKAGPVTVVATVGGQTLTYNVQVLYKDVSNPKEYWFLPTNYLTNQDVVKGYDGQTTFKPGNNCTRAQMVTFLWRLKGSPKPTSSSTKFKDVKKSAYYYKAVLWAVEKGITTGYSKTKFKPNNVCTRAQTVTFLWRMANKPKAGNTKNKFKDINKTDYFYDAVLWASGKGIVEGYKNGTFRPQNKCTRRQMVTFLYKYDKFVNGKG